MALYRNAQKTCKRRRHKKCLRQCVIEAASRQMAYRAMPAAGYLSPTIEYEETFAPPGHDYHRLRREAAAFFERHRRLLIGRRRYSSVLYYRCAAMPLISQEFISTRRWRRSAISLSAR